MSESKEDNSHEPAKDAVFDAYAAYYDLLYQDKDYAGEADYINRLIQQHRPAAKLILELGSGTGKHARLLAGKGYSVHGVERSSEMLARARCEGETQSIVTVDGKLPSSVVFSQGDVRDIRLNTKVDVVMSLFHVMSYMTTTEDLLAAIKSAGAHLDPGGLFLFDVWYGPAVLTELPMCRVKRVANERMSLIRIAEPTLLSRINCVNVHYDVFVKDQGTDRIIHLEEDHLMRYWFEPELQFLLASQQFEICSAHEWLTCESPSARSWGVVFVCKFKSQ